MTRPSPPASPWTLALGVALAVVFGLIVFATLSAGRQALADDSAPGEATSPPPAAALPVTALAPAHASPAPALPPAAPPAPIRPPERTPPGYSSFSLHAPALVIDLSTARTADAATADPNPPPAPASGSAEARFDAGAASGGIEPPSAGAPSDLPHTAPPGETSPAVVDTAMASDLPGSVRAPLQGGSLASAARQPAVLAAPLRSEQGTPLRVFLVRDLDPNLDLGDGGAPPRR